MGGGGSKRNHGGTARPIRTRRDFKAAAFVVESIAPQAEKETAAEKRLRALINEMEKFDGGEEEGDSDDASGGEYDGPRRRWSDDSGDPDR
jgi:hypothetical protein